MDLQNFYRGNEFEAYAWLGAHTYWGGTTFRTFAPNAKHIALICDFNNWEEIPMNKTADGNFWEISVEGIKAGNMYKYRIYGQDGSAVDHADPYAYYAQLRPDSASIVYDLGGYEFKDQEWINKRYELKNGPLNIYEMHFGSWKKKDDEIPDGGWYTYSELAELLIPYLKENGYNALEIMPLNEYPFDGSWGYQSTGYFAPTSRYGKPEELCEFVDKCHEAGIMVLLDFVPVHFASDAFGLRNYDGSALFEYPNNAVGINEWGSCNFMHSRGETCSFLKSSANFWIYYYHFDGLRLDAVSNLIYWQGNEGRGENKNTIDFIKSFNAGLHMRNPGIIICAEDSSAYGGVTKPVEEGGLGFDFKWDLGWMNDTLEYFATAPDDRTAKYHKLTFSMMYFYNEHFILPLSHDEVVHGKATIVQKMSDLYEGKFQQARAFYMYMFAHPGKKLNFMGNEIGQLREWDEKREQDWDMLKYPMHDSFHHFMSELNKLYLEHPAFYERDYAGDGFNWIDCHQESELIYVFERKSNDETILAVFNFSNYDHDYTLNLEGNYTLTPLLNSNWEEFSGTEKKDVNPIKVTNEITLKLSRESAQYFTVNANTKKDIQAT